MDEQPGNTFPVTRWTWVGDATQPDDDKRLAALEAFLRLYYPALMAYVRGQFRPGGADAEDAVQEFILDKVIRRRVVGKSGSGSRAVSHLPLPIIEPVHDRPPAQGNRTQTRAP